VGQGSYRDASKLHRLNRHFARKIVRPIEKVLCIAWQRLDRKKEDEALWKTEELPVLVELSRNLIVYHFLM